MSAAPNGTFPTDERATNVQTPTIDIARHTKYFLRCLKSPLPIHYTPTDSNRMALAFYIISGLDLLDALDSNITPQERSGYIDWVYHCQHLNGGFRGYTGGPGPFGRQAAQRAQPEHSEQTRQKTSSKTDWDPAAMSATYFALCILLILNDDLSRLDRSACLAWLTTLQRSDGSFGETLIDNTIHGGHDARFGYCAAGIAYILGYNSQRDTFVAVTGARSNPTLNTEAFARQIRSTQTFDGGISGLVGQESHAGFTFCAVAALHLFNRHRHRQLISDASHSTTSHDNDETNTDKDIDATLDIDALIKWLVSRQTRDLYLVPQHGGDSDGQDDDNDDNDDREYNEYNELNDEHDHSHDAKNEQVPLLCGINGRANKVADTCYAFWVSGTLSILSSDERADSNNNDASTASTIATTAAATTTSSLRKYLNPTPILNWLTSKTNHELLGGFGKHAGDLPDLYHSYLGLASCSLLLSGLEGLGGLEALQDGRGIRELDPALCISGRAAGRVQTLSWNLATELEGAKGG